MPMVPDQPYDSPAAWKGPEIVQSSDWVHTLSGDEIAVVGYPLHGKTSYRLAGWLVGWPAGWLPGWLAGPPPPETPKNQLLKPFLEQW